MITQNDIDWLKDNGFRIDLSCREANMVNGKVWKRTFTFDGTKWRKDTHRLCLMVFYMDNCTEPGWMAHCGLAMHWEGGRTYDTAERAVWHAVHAFMGNMDRKMAELFELKYCANMIQRMMEL